MFQTAAPVPEREKGLTCLTAEKAPLYRAIMRVFMESNERFALRLRPQEILDGLVTTPEPPHQTEVDSALTQLCEWGNLEAHPDTGAVRTVEDFYKQRYVYQITFQGEAAEQAREIFEANAARKAELPGTALADVRNVLHALSRTSRETEPDNAEIHRNLLILRTRFDHLAGCAQTFMGNLQRSADRQDLDNGGIASRQGLIDYLERFIADLVIAADEIASGIQEIEANGVDRLLQAAAERSIADAMERTPQDLDRALDQWRIEWTAIRDWFVSRPAFPSNAELLRQTARATIPVLVTSIASVHDRRNARIDRANDLRVLARWFAEAESDAAAHRLWRAAFSLSSSRHLTTNDATLDQHDEYEVRPDTSWLEAPPVRISPRLRARGNYSRNGRLSRIIDRTAEKKELAAVTHAEALRLLEAQARFASRNRMRLSDFDRLESHEFEIFLELLGNSVSETTLANETAEALSSGGSLRLRLEPTDDGRMANIQTPDGMFVGPDHWICVEPGALEDVLS